MAAESMFTTIADYPTQLLREGAVFTSLLTLFSFMCAKIHFVPSLLALWFTALNGISACLYSSWPPALASIVDARGKTRFKRVIFRIGGAFYGPASHPNCI